MHLLNPDDPLKAMIDSYLVPFAESVCSCANSFFRTSCSITNKWKTVERLNGEFVHNIVLGSGNERFKALAVVGLNKTEAEEILHSNSSEEILDAFGEMLNSVWAILADNPAFRKDFGVLLQSFPQYSSETNYYPRTWGCNGALTTPENGAIYFGFAFKQKPIS